MATGHVRRQDYLFEIPQRAFVGQRLALEDIGPRPRDSYLLKRFDHRALVDNFAAADIDQVGAWLHRRELRRADKSARLRGKRQGDSDVIAFGQDRLALVGAEESPGDTTLGVAASL